MSFDALINERVKENISVKLVQYNNRFHELLNAGVELEEAITAVFGDLSPDLQDVALKLQTVKDAFEALVQEQQAAGNLHGMRINV